MPGAADPRPAGRAVDPAAHRTRHPQIVWLCLKGGDAPSTNCPSESQSHQNHKEMKMRKAFSIFSILMIAALLLSACGAKAEEVKLLRVWIQWGDNPQQIQTLFDKYTTKTGIKVEVTAPLEEDKILPALTGSEPPDVLVLSGGDLVKSYDKEKLVTELTDVIKTGGIDLNDFFAAPLDQCKYGDKILCLPWGTDMYALFWNKDMFEAAGLDPNTP